MNETIDLTALINLLITFLVTCVSLFVVPWIKKNITAKDREEMLKWIDIAVMAAQQMLYTSTGQERKQYVLNFLSTKGYDINSDEIEKAIEASVLKLHQQLET